MRELLKSSRQRRVAQPEVGPVEVVMIIIEIKCTINVMHSHAC